MKRFVFVVAFIVFFLFMGSIVYSSSAPRVAIETNCLNDACTTYNMIIYPYTSSHVLSSVSANLNRVRLTLRNPSSNSVAFFVSESSISTISGDPVYSTEVMVERYYRGVFYFVTNASTITVNVQEISKP